MRKIVPFFGGERWTGRSDASSLPAFDAGDCAVSQRSVRVELVAVVITVGAGPSTRMIEGVVFAGDVLFRQCTPMAWTGSYDKWFQCLDLLMQLDPQVIVPGHGPVCGIEGVREMKAYLQYVRDESKKCFDAGLTSLDAAKRIEFGPYGEWRAPARLYMNVERAYCEFRNEAPDAPWDSAATFDAIYQVAKAKGIEAEF
jgi:hypothetical protein